VQITSNHVHFLISYAVAFLAFGLTIAGIIRERAHSQYPGTLVVRSYFIVCLLALYWMSADPLFLVILGIVLVGVALTLTCYLADRA
jgi:hypothetical protein